MCGLITLLLMVLGLGFFTVVPASVEIGSPSEAVLVAPATPVRDFSTPMPPMNEILEICPTPSGERDYDLAQDFGRNAFAVGDWEATYAESGARSTMTWRSNEFGGLAYLELLHYDCGYDDATLDTYFSGDAWDVIFSGYQSYEQTAVCVVNGLRLHEFNLRFDSTDYITRFWIDEFSETRVATFNLVFPATGIEHMDTFAELVYPELPSCESL